MMNMKMDDYCTLVANQEQQHHHQHSPYSDMPQGHHDSFSSASSGSSSSYDPFTPVSGRSSPNIDHRLGSVSSVDFNAANAAAAAAAAGSFSGVTLDLTPPPSATVPYFNLTMPPNAAAAAAAAASMAMVTTTSAPDMTSSYLSSSSFPHAPATPERHNSISSHGTATSPTSPSHMLSSSYPASISSMSSMTSMSSVGSSTSHNVLCGPATPDAYPFPEMHSKQQQSTQAHQHQQPLPPFSQRPHHHSPTYMFPTPPPSHAMHNECGDISPSEFYWQSRPESPPIASFFDERPSLPPPPPSATLKSSVVKRETGSEEYYSHEDDRRYSTASSASSYSTTPTPRRRLFLDNAQLKTAALHKRIGTPHYGHYSSGNNSPTMGGTIITRNGIQVSKVSSGAFKCIVPGCPSRPFKRSEHLKRHVTTHHENKDAFPCEFCGRSFNRKDNWRSHLKLHTVSRGKNARTDYYAKAVRVYDEEMRKVSKCRPRKEKGYHM